MISVERASDLGVLVQIGGEGVAEAEAKTDEEKELVAQLRESVQPVPGMIVDFPVEFAFDPADSPDFDSDAWEAAGFPKDRKHEFVREYKPKPIDWMPGQ